MPQWIDHIWQPILSLVLWWQRELLWVCWMSCRKKHTCDTSSVGHDQVCSISITLRVWREFTTRQIRYMFQCLEIIKQMIVVWFKTACHPFYKTVTHGPSGLLEPTVRLAQFVQQACWHHTVPRYLGVVGHLENSYCGCWFCGFELLEWVWEVCVLKMCHT